MNPKSPENRPQTRHFLQNRLLHPPHSLPKCQPVSRSSRTTNEAGASTGHMKRAGVTATCSASGLLHDSVRPLQKFWWDCGADRLSGLKIEYEFSFCDHLNRQVGRFRSLENPVRKNCQSPPGISDTSSIGNQAARLRLAARKYCRQNDFSKLDRQPAFGR